MDVQKEIEKLKKKQTYENMRTVDSIIRTVSYTVCEVLCKYTQEATEEELEQICKHCPLDKLF